MRQTLLFVALFCATFAGGGGALAATHPNCQAALDYSTARRGAAVLVLRNGEVICEGYAGEGAPDKGMEIASGTKSFSGIMLAAAVQDGLIKLDEPVSATITEWRDDPIKAKVTIRELLNLTSGLRSRVGPAPSFADAIQLPFTAAPGAAFQYGPGAFQVFGEVMRRKLAAAGQDPDPYAYLSRRILAPIGLNPNNWRRHASSGDILLAQGAILTVREWVKFGELVRAGGRHKGRALVDGATFRAQFGGSTPNPAYGVTWWLPNATPAADVVTATVDIQKDPGLPRDLVLAAGAGDQRLFVVPSQGLAIARLASFDMSQVLVPREQRGPQGPAWSDATFARFFLK
jgi:CubicO group peptidase (beta-lactamase class C family)